MGRHTLNDAEQGFLDTLLGEAAEKVAVELEPETAEALGVQTVRPSDLDNIEAAAGGEQPQPEPDPEPGPESEFEPSPPPEPEPEETQVDLEPLDPVDKPPDEEAADEPDLPLRATVGGVFANKRAHPIALLDLLTLRYEQDWLDWESDTLYWAIRRSFGPVGDLNRNKIMAIRLAATSDIPWLDFDVFEDCGLAWNDIVPIIGSFQPMTPMQTAFAVQCLREIRPEEEFSHEVLSYIAAILDEHGWSYAPEEYFAGAQEILTAGERHLLPLQVEVRKAWETVRNMDPEQIAFNEENPRDIHLLKLFVVQRYIQEREALRESAVRPAATGQTSPPIPR